MRSKSKIIIKRTAVDHY